MIIAQEKRKTNIAEFILYMWQKINFIGTMEWLMAISVKRKKKGRKRDPLNIEGTLISPEPVLWVHPIEKTEIPYHYQGPNPTNENEASKSPS